MKSMKNFAAQQLTKKQMNEVKGGDNGAFDNCGTLYYCEWEGGQTYVCSKQAQEMKVIFDSDAKCRVA